MNSSLSIMPALKIALRVALAALLISLNGPAVRGAVTTTHYFRLGENDPGSVQDGVVTQGTDLMVASPLQASGNPTFTGNIATTAVQRTRSTLALDLDGGFQALWQLDSLVVPTTNFGLELWVRPRFLPEGFTIVAYNGDTRANGWGIYQNGGTFGVSIGGVDRLGTAPAVPDQWTHLALVNEDGRSTFFVNGFATEERWITPLEPQGGFAIGAHPQPPLGEYFSGWVDEVRVFTFLPGEFVPEDLLVRQEAITLPPDSLTHDQAVLHGGIVLENEPVSAWFEYGQGTELTTATPPQSISSDDASVSLSAVLEGLNPGTVYQCRLVSSNAVRVSRGITLSFRTHAAVTSLENDGPGSLRQTIREAAPWETIHLLAEGTIKLTNSSLEITRPLTIVGVNPLAHIIDGGDAVRLLIVRPGATVTLEGLTLTKGQAPHGRRASTEPLGLGLPTEGEGGGAVLNQGKLNLVRCILEGNKAGNGGGFSIGVPLFGSIGASGGAGGAIYSEGVLTTRSCLFMSNSAGAGGQGAQKFGSTSNPVTSYAGGSGGSGGAIFNLGSARIQTTSFVDNYAGRGGAGGAEGGLFSGVRQGPAGTGGDGGAVLNEGSIDLIQSTLTQNSAGGRGSAVSNRGTTSQVALLACSVVWNTITTPGQSAAIDNQSNESSIGLRSCLIGQNIGEGGSPDLIGRFSSGGFNVISVVTPSASGLVDGVHSDRCGSDVTPLELHLGPLTALTDLCRAHPPTLLSPALEAGDDSLLTSPLQLLEDQAGNPRLVGHHVDAGAVELGGSIPEASATTLDATLLDEPDPTTGSRRAVLSGLVTPAGPTSRVYFELGLNPTYKGGLVTPFTPSGYLTMQVTQLVSSLVPGFTYHYRIGFSNALGVTVGGDKTFTFSSPQIPGDTDQDGVISGKELMAVVHRYWSNPAWLRMTNVVGLGGTNVSFELPGAMGNPLSVESTTDFVSWQLIGSAEPRLEFTDTNAPSATPTFYRLALPYP